MNIWLVASLVLLLALVPVTIATLRGNALDRLIAMELGGIITTIALITFAVGTERSVYVDAAVAVALLSFGGGIAYARFLERWL